MNTTPNTGTYFPPKVMCDGQWRYMVGVTEWHDHEHDAREAHRLQARVVELEARIAELEEENALIKMQHDADAAAIGQMARKLTR